eukprot:g32616.t1
MVWDRPDGFVESVITGHEGSVWAVAVDWDCAHKALEASKGIGLQPKQQGEEEPRTARPLPARRRTPRTPRTPRGSPTARPVKRRGDEHESAGSSAAGASGVEAIRVSTRNARSRTAAAENAEEDLSARRPNWPEIDGSRAMAPKKKTEKVEDEVPQSEDHTPPMKCLRAPGQLYYGDVKAGYHERKGRWIRHGKGLQVVTALAPKVWPDGSSYEGSWNAGALHGQGRFDSRFDGGRYMQGQFHFNCFQRSDGRWVDILQHIKNHELREMLGATPIPYRVTMDPAELAQVLEEQRNEHLARLTEAMEELQVFIQAQFNSSSSLLIREFNRRSFDRRSRESLRFPTNGTRSAVFDDITHFSDVQLLRKKMKRMCWGRSAKAATINTDAIPVVEATSSQSQRNTARFTFVRGKAAKYQERATKAAMQRITESAVNLASRASRYNVQVEESNTWAPRVYAWVTSRRFMFAMMSIIFLNLILLGIEVEVSAYLPLREVPTFFFVANIIIVCIYTLEMSLKLIAFGVTGFFFGPERLWNIFDFAIITLALVETIGDVVATAASSYLEMDSSFFRILRFVRLGRALRGIRVIRLIHYVGALRTLVFAILSTAASLFWTLVLLVLVFYIFGIMFAQIVTDTCEQPGGRGNCVNADYMSVPKCHDNGLTTYWFGVIESMLTLFMVVSGGVNWEDIIRPLRPVSAFAVACLILYIVISVFTILNVVAASETQIRLALAEASGLEASEAFGSEVLQG